MAAYTSRLAAMLGIDAGDISLSVEAVADRADQARLVAAIRAADSPTAQALEARLASAARGPPSALAASLGVPVSAAAASNDDTAQERSMATNSTSNASQGTSANARSRPQRGATQTCSGAGSLIAVSSTDPLPFGHAAHVAGSAQAHGAAAAGAAAASTAADCATGAPPTTPRQMAATKPSSTLGARSASTSAIASTDRHGHSSAAELGTSGRSGGGVAVARESLPPAAGGMPLGRGRRPQVEPDYGTLATIVRPLSPPLEAFNFPPRPPTGDSTHEHARPLSTASTTHDVHALGMPHTRPPGAPIDQLHAPLRRPPRSVSLGALAPPRPLTSAAAAPTQCRSSACLAAAPFKMMSAKGFGDDACGVDAGSMASLLTLSSADARQRQLRRAWLAHGAAPAAVYPPIQSASCRPALPPAPPLSSTRAADGANDTRPPRAACGDLGGDDGAMARAPPMTAPAVAPGTAEDRRGSGARASRKGTPALVVQPLADPRKLLLDLPASPASRAAHEELRKLQAMAAAPRSRLRQARSGSPTSVALEASLRSKLGTPAIKVRGAAV